VITQLLENLSLLLIILPLLAISRNLFLETLGYQMPHQLLHTHYCTWHASSHIK